MQSKSITAIVVDDEKPSREALSTYIHDFCNGVEIVAECDSIKSAHKAITEFNPQLVFLDIEMPNGNGFDLLKLFKTLPFKVIFVTAFSEYAIRAFRYSATDYLLKPVKIDELVDAVDKVRHEIDKDYSNLNLGILLEALSQGNHQNLVVRDNKGFTVVKTAELIMCEADGYCTNLYLTGHRKIISTKSLKHFEELFENKQLIKVHRSYIVNLSKIAGYTRQGEIRLEENLTCPLGDNYKQQFLDRFEG